MFKFLTIIFLTFINPILSINCYTPVDVSNKGLVSYQNKVYDIKDYIHPGGQDTLNLAIGKPLETFFNMPNYRFHINSKATERDLKDHYVGDLYQYCGNVVNTEPNNVNTILDIIKDPPIFYSIISLSTFTILILGILIVNYTDLYSEKIVNLFFTFTTVDYLLIYIIYSLWWASLLVLSLLSNDDDLLERLGIWICLNLAFTILPSTRNSIWIKLLNTKYDKLLSIHKTIAIYCVLSVIIKIVFVILEYDFMFLFGRFNMIMGTVCSLCIILTSTLANPLIRKNLYELFYYTHRIFPVLIIITMTLHYSICIYYMIPSFILYLSDLLIRIIYINKSVYTKIQSHKFKDDTIYHIINLKILKELNIFPGSYFLICCSNISKSEWHPVSVLSVKNNVLTFCIKDMGKNSWSNKLIKLKNENDLFSDDASIFIQGPYKHFKLNYNYDYTLFIANGVGITPFFTIFEDINTKGFLFSNKKVSFVWIISHETYIIPFINNLENVNTNLINITIFITSEQENNILYLDEKYFSLFNITYIKPNIDTYISNFMIKENVYDSQNMCIYSCCSQSLTNDIIKSSYKNNIHLFKENF
jgi:predicted ferric reductase